jgi:hypothetical protein
MQQICDQETGLDLGVTQRCPEEATCVEVADRSGMALQLSIWAMSFISDRRIETTKDLPRQIPGPERTKSSHQFSLFFAFRNCLIGRTKFIGIVLRNAKQHCCAAMNVACQHAVG